MIFSFQMLLLILALTVVVSFVGLAISAYGISKNSDTISLSGAILSKVAVMARGLAPVVFALLTIAHLTGDNADQPAANSNAFRTDSASASDDGLSESDYNSDSSDDDDHSEKFSR